MTITLPEWATEPGRYVSLQVHTEPPHWIACIVGGGRAEYFAGTGTDADLATATPQEAESAWNDFRGRRRTTAQPA